MSGLGMSGLWFGSVLKVQGDDGIIVPGVHTAVVGVESHGVSGVINLRVVSFVLRHSQNNRVG